MHNTNDKDSNRASRRVQKVAEAIREVVSMSILTELQDPRVRDVTVTGVEASRDLHYAKVMVSVMGDETRQKLTLRGLQSAAGFLQAKIADRIDLRYTPRLTFVLDQGVKRSISVARILREVLPKEEPEAEAASPAGEGSAVADEAVAGPDMTQTASGDPSSGTASPPQAPLAPPPPSDPQAPIRP